jgi:low affinity Fe/Cu permease
MVYNYEGDGVVKVQGSAKQWRKVYYYQKYQRYSIAKSQPKYKGKDIVYRKSAAMKGKLDKVVIDQVILKNTEKTFFQNVTFYQDIMNTLYKEDELISLDEAKSLAITYLLSKRQQLVDIINQLNGDSD